MKKALPLAILFQACLPSHAAHAVGGMEGGGGAVAVCRDSHRHIKFARMEDLYEGRYKYHYSIPESGEAPEQQITKLIAKVHYPFHRVALTEATAATIRAMIFLPPGVGLAPSTDLGNEFGILIPEGCEIEPVGFYNADGTLEVSREIYEHLDAQNRAAFILHEAVYKLARETAGRTDSSDSRHAVAALFADLPQIEPSAPDLLINQLIFSSYPGPSFDHFIPFLAYAIVSHPDQKFTLKVHPKNEGGYGLNIFDYTFSDYRAGNPFPDPSFDFNCWGLDCQREITDEHDLVTLTVALDAKDDDPALNLSQSFEFQLLDDRGAVVAAGTYDPNIAPEKQPRRLAVAIARVTPLPPIPRP